MESEVAIEMYKYESKGGNEQTQHLTMN